jgi:CheY-like chemotaxis protein
MAVNRVGRVARTPARAGVSSVDRPNTVGLSGRELAAILDAFDAAESGGVSPRREFIRWPFRHAGIQVSFSHPGGSLVSLKLAGRNISKGGLSVLHNAFVHPGTECTVQLPKSQGGTLERSATVSRCIHRRGTLHELGLRFSTPIRLRDFVCSSTRGDVNSLERVDPSRLRGRMLFAGDNPLDAKIVAHFLRESSISVVVADNLESGRQRLHEQFDILLIDARLPDGRGSDLLTTARNQGTMTPAILIAADPASLSADPVWNLPGVRMLPKPFTQAQLLQDLGEVLLVESRDTSMLPVNQETLPNAIASAYAKDIVQSLEKSIADRTRDRTVELCHQLRGSGGMLGMKAAASVADRACAAFGGSPTPADEASVLRELVAACRKDLDRLQDSPD